MFREYRKSINPPYNKKDLVVILGTILILITIPATVFLSSQTREPTSRAKSDPIDCFPGRNQSSSRLNNEHANGSEDGVAVVPPAAYAGAVQIPSSIEDQTKRAELITVGKVKKVSSRKVQGSIVTDVNLGVEQILKGDKTKKSITITIDGGQVGDLCLYAGGVPNFLEGERVLLFLDNNDNPRLVQLWQSKYSLAGTEAIQPESDKSRVSIKSVGERVGKALGKPVSIKEEDETVDVIEFIVGCPAWPVSKMPVLIEVNPANPGNGGPLGNDFLRLVYTSLNSWQALPDSYPAFSLTGQTSNLGNDHFDRLNTVVWSTLNPGVLGRHWCAQSGGVHVDSDVEIANTGFTWDPDSSDGVIGFSLESVLEHEFGHSVGLSHSDQCGFPRPLMCSGISSGERKTIQADDQAGAAFLYPLSGSPPGAPSNLTVNSGANSNSLSWNSGSGSTFATEIERSDSGCSGTFKSVQTIAAGPTAFVDDNHGDGLGAGIYCYRIKTLGVGGDSVYLVEDSGPPDTEDPVVSITAPSGGATVSDTVNISASASDNIGVTKVEFFVDGVLLDSDNSNPYSVSWDTTIISNNNHVLTAKAYDAAGNVGTSASVSVLVSNIDSQAPTVSIIDNGGDGRGGGEPEEVSGVHTIQANASDNIGVTNVEFYVDGVLIGSDTTSPYSFNWDTTSVANGDRDLTAKAYDAAGNVGTSSPVTVVVNNSTSGNPADINDDGFVDVTDLSILLSNWNTSDATADINNDGEVNIFDLSILLSNWTG